MIEFLFKDGLLGFITMVVIKPGWYMLGGGHVLVTKFRGMALNGLFCADVLRSLDLASLTDFTYKYHRG